MNRETGELSVSYITGEPLYSACPVIRVLSPLGKLKGKVSLEIPARKPGNNNFVRNDRIYHSDIILMQRTCFPGESVAEWRSSWRKIIYEIDDYLLDIPKNNPNHIISKELKDKIIDTVKESDAVVVSTGALKERLRAYNENIYVLPNYIDLEIWGGGGLIPTGNGKRLVVGWIGTPTHRDDIDRLAPAIARVVKRYGKDVVFRFWGCMTDRLSRIPQVENMRGLIPNYRDYANYMKTIDIDIALAPLQRNPFNECKSNIKFLEYSVCNVPGIYSRIAPYTESVVDGKTGILCDEDPDSWYGAMVRFIEDEDFRRNVAENAHREIMDNFTLEGNAYKWLDLYTELAERNTPVPSLCESKSGSGSLRIEGDDGALRIFHSLYAPESEAAAVVDAFRFDGDGFVVVLGLGLGYHVAELARRHPNAVIVVVEMLPSVHEMAMERGTISGLEGRVAFIVGYPQKLAISEITRLQLKAGMPPLSVLPLAPALSAHTDYYRPILGALSNAISVNMRDRLRYPKFRDDRHTVALFDFNYFLTEEIARAVKALGHSVVRVRGRKDESCGDILGRAIETIATHKPDFFLTVNHLGFDEDGVLADLFRSIEMPSAIWYVDSPNLVVRAFPENVSPFSSIFVWDEGYLDTMKSLGFENVSYLPLGVDETVFRPKSLSSSERKRMEADLGFVGNSMVGPARDQLAKVPRDLHASVERIAKRLNIARNVPYGEAARESMNPDERAAFESLGESDKSGFEAAVLWRATLLYRVSCLRTLEEFRPCIRGDAGWKGLVNGKSRLGPQLNYYKELPSFYNACTVNFNATSIQMGKAVNQRVFDVPACGAFLLTDHQESIEGLFEVGKEVVTYKDRGEIADLARFYLRNDAARRTIAGKGRERVLAEHTYRHRIETIAQRLREVYG